MAFIFESERLDPIHLSKSQTPGPGQYISLTENKNNRGYAPFLSTVERAVNNKKTKNIQPGPGAYDPVLTISNSVKPNKTFHATLSPDQEDIKLATNTTAFKSKTKRFEYKIDTEMPGPGMYYSNKDFAKTNPAPFLSVKSASTFPIQKLTRENKPAIPSIPSYVHSYGYSEEDGHKLSLNKNPLIEIQQFVGPGYYDVKEEFQPSSNKGTTWHKYGSRRFDSQGNKPATKNVGPGSYDLLKREIPDPLYKGKASSGFASTTGRAGPGGIRLNPTKIQARTAEALNFAIGLDTPFEGFDEAMREQAIREGDMPGPGHYHNDRTTSSLKLSYKPTKLQFFGSSSLRFQDEGSNGVQLGPGEYQVSENKKKSKIKAGFQSSEPRIKAFNSTSLGPGKYEVKNSLLDQIQDKAKKGYLGSFGSTELRFKAEKVAEGNKTAEHEAPQPRIEYNDEPNKPSHYFVSRTEKVPEPREKAPPPGSYDVNYYDISKKVEDKDSVYYKAKKVPFKSSETRFKPNAPEINVQDPNDLHLVNKMNTTFKAAIRPTPASMFSSKTLRAVSCDPKQTAPGPGTYHNTLNQNTWSKKTFNIKYLEQ